MNRNLYQPEPSRARLERGQAVAIVVFFACVIATVVGLLAGASALSVRIQAAMSERTNCLEQIAFEGKASCSNI